MEYYQPCRSEAFDDITNRLVVAAQLVSYHRGPFPSGGCQQDLAASQDKSIGRMQAFLDLLSFVFSE